LFKRKVKERWDFWNFGGLIIGSGKIFQLGFSKVGEELVIRKEPFPKTRLRKKTKGQPFFNLFQRVNY